VSPIPPTVGSGKEHTTKGTLMSDDSVLISLLVLTASGVAFFFLRSGENLRFETPAEPHRIVMAAVAIIATKRNWQVMAQCDEGASFRYHRRPNALIAVVLMLFFLIPGIVYLVLAGKRESLVLNIYSDTTGMTVAQLTSNGFRGKFAGRALAQQVSVRAGTMAMDEAPQTSAIGALH
jgi:hypothetical protein